MQEEEKGVDQEFRRRPGFGEELEIWPRRLLGRARRSQEAARENREEPGGG